MHDSGAVHFNRVRADRTSADLAHSETRTDRERASESSAHPRFDRGESHGRDGRVRRQAEHLDSTRIDDASDVGAWSAHDGPVLREGERLTEPVTRIGASRSERLRGDPAFGR